MHPADIQASLRKKGHRQSQLARRLGVTDGAVYLVVQGQSKSQRIALAISEATGLAVGQLWPQKYPKLEKLQAIQAVQATRPARAVKPAAGGSARPAAAAGRKAA